MSQDKLEEAKQWRELGDKNVMEGKNTAAEAAYALADNKERQARTAWPGLP